MTRRPLDTLPEFADDLAIGMAHASAGRGECQGRENNSAAVDFALAFVWQMCCNWVADLEAKMGCDIHLVLERKHGERWIAVDTFCGHDIDNRTDNLDWAAPAATARNYKRFAALAGVRGNGPSPHGVPNNASETTKFLVENYGDDGHSHSYLSLEKAIKIFAETEYWRDFEPPEHYHRKYPSNFFFGVETDNVYEYRLVFWFDC